MKRGLLITFEGPEGSGKSTLCKYALRLLRQYGTPVLFREPGATKAGEAVRSILLDSRIPIDPETELLLYFTARSQLVREKIRPALAKKKIVLCDRYHDSTVAYQGYGLGLPLSAIKQVGDLVKGGVEPDLTILVDVPVTLGLKRSGRGDRIEKRNHSFHEKVRQGFLEIAKTEKRVKVLDGAKALNEVKKDLKVLLERYFAKKMRTHG